MTLKSLIRNTLNSLHLDLTKNLEYDRLTRLIMERVIQPNSNCIDIGCHKGEMLDTILNLAPEGEHFAFEPIPSLFKELSDRYQHRAGIFQHALSDHDGTATFQHVKNAPAYSGLMKRKYQVENPDIEEITVSLTTLDAIIPLRTKISFIKIDVEGGEFDVLRGGVELLKRDAPVVIFESGLGASEFYGTKSADLFDFLTVNCNLRISLLKGFARNEKPLTGEEFESCYRSNKEWYYVAHP